MLWIVIILSERWADSKLKGRGSLRCLKALNVINDACTGLTDHCKRLFYWRKMMMVMVMMMNNGELLLNGGWACLQLLCCRLKR